EKMYQQVSTLSRNIARFLPLEDLTWKEAEREFERQFLSQVLKEHSGKVSETAKKMKLRQETLYRKIKKLGLGQP
ncbi:MAG: helix-turn-helix domain-containing protein, partial [Nanoarchaeota archaeon]